MTLWIGLATTGGSAASPLVDALKVGSGVTTGLGLLGLCAVLFFFFKMKQADKHREELHAVPESERAETARRKAGEFGITVADASPEQAVQLAERELERRHERHLVGVKWGLAAAVICFVTATAAAVAVAVIKPSDPDGPVHRDRFNPPTPTVQADLRTDGKVVVTLRYAPVTLPEGWSLIAQVSPSPEFTAGAGTSIFELDGSERGTATFTINRFPRDQTTLWVRVGGVPPDNQPPRYGVKAQTTVVSP